MYSQSFIHRMEELSDLPLKKSISKVSLRLKVVVSSSVPIKASYSKVPVLKSWQLRSGL